MSEYFGHYGKHVSVLPCSLGIQSVLLAPCQNYLWLYKRYLWPLECSQPRAGQAGHVRELKPWEAVLHQLQMGFVRKIPQVSQLSVRTDLKCFPPAGLRPSAGISYLFISIPSGFLHLPALSPHSAVTASWGHFSQINSLHSSPDLRVCFCADCTENFYHIFQNLIIETILIVLLNLSFCPFLCQPFSIILFIPLHFKVI